MWSKVWKELCFYCDAQTTMPDAKKKKKKRSNWRYVTEWTSRTSSDPYLMVSKRRNLFFRIRLKCLVGGFVITYFALKSPLHHFCVVEKSIEITLRTFGKLKTLLTVEVCLGLMCYFHDTLLLHFACVDGAIKIKRDKLILLPNSKRTNRVHLLLLIHKLA